jgi:hypothetical protein
MMRRKYSRAVFVAATVYRPHADLATMADILSAIHRRNILITRAIGGELSGDLTFRLTFRRRLDGKP